MELLLLVIPFEDTGAMETFLLNAIANDSAYDAEIIRKGNQFVEEVDKERKYLTKRRYITKSKFDVYFSIRTAAEQFVERQNILKRVPWEQYSQIQEEFQKLKDFGIPGTIGDGDLWLFWCPWWHFIKNRLVYCMCAVNNVRIILRREMLIKKIFWGILLDFLIPVLICFIILSIATGNWEDALIVLQEERRKCIILVLFIIFSNAIIVFAVGYCMVYSFQKDLIEKNRKNKRKEPKKNLSRKHKYRWKNKDYQLIGWLLIIVAIVFYGAYVNWQGIQNAQKQELFLTTRIDNDTYIVVMTDGDEAILEKDRTGKDGKLKICKDKYMKVDCKNRLLEKKKYRRASGDGE